MSQTFVMCLYMLVGFTLFKTGKITTAGSKDLATLLLWLVIPSVLINSFCVEFTAEKLNNFLLSSLIGALALLVAIIVARILFPKAPIDDFAAAFSNAGFIGIPLVQASLGAEAVFYLVGIVAILNVLQWTYGVAVLTRRKDAVKLKNILFNPILMGAVIGLIVFFTGLGTKLPKIVSTTISGLAALNAPLAMLILGGYLAQSDLKATFLSFKLYWLSVVRLLVIPLITLGVFWLIPMSTDIKMAVFIAACAPVGSNVAVYAQLNGLDYPYACQTVALSTVLSIGTVPLILLIAGLVL